ncbi:MAG: heterodisulfide reductase-related iron-sulfur binding cluster, partial [Gemmatimonadaceae bacterium]
MAMLESTRQTLNRQPYRATGDGSRGRATLLTGCVMDGLFLETNRATERTLVANDYAVVSTRGQSCCGALHAHAGDADAARALARRNIVAFGKTSADYIVVNAAGCGEMLKHYGQLLPDDPRATLVRAATRTLAELLAETPGWLPPHLDGVSVVAQPHCHQH